MQADAINKTAPLTVSGRFNPGTVCRERQGSLESPWWGTGVLILGG